MTRSAGNPLFAEHLVLQGPGGPLPETLSELLVSRVVALPEDTQRVLRAAAVIGRPATVRLIALTAGSSVEETERDLREAVTQHVAEVRRGDTIGFRHPAFAEVVYADLLPEQRRSLHRAAAEALESAAPPSEASGNQDTVAAELARHWAEADDAPRALDAAVAAGRAAEQMFAFAAAQASYARAVDLLAQVPESSHDRVWLLEARGAGREPRRRQRRGGPAGRAGAAAGRRPNGPSLPLDPTRVDPLPRRAWTPGGAVVPGGARSGPGRRGERPGRPDQRGSRPAGRSVVAAR